MTFRDWLRFNTDQAQTYEQIKRQLAEHHAGAADYDDYTRAKSAFFDQTDAAMRAWARNRPPAR